MDLTVTLEVNDKSVDKVILEKGLHVNVNNKDTLSYSRINTETLCQFVFAPIHTSCFWCPVHFLFGIWVGLSLSLSFSFSPD